jgi:predicted Rossmann fold nucleotide-binding protein DprA/Smf involved in DNA uptake
MTHPRYFGLSAEPRDRSATARWGLSDVFDNNDPQRGKICSGSSFDEGLCAVETTAIVGIYRHISEPVQRTQQRFRRADQHQLQRIEWRSRSAAILSECQQLGVRLLAVTEDDYPPLLKQIAVPPPILFVLGDDTNLHLPLLAVVGSRRMTSGGARNAHLWSRHLTTCGFTITSGLALGVDGVADEAAIEVEGGRTVAINHWPSGSSLVVVV